MGQFLKNGVFLSLLFGSLIAGATATEPSRQSCNFLYEKMVSQARAIRGKWGEREIQRIIGQRESTPDGEITLTDKQKRLLRETVSALKDVNDIDVALRIFDKVTGFHDEKPLDLQSENERRESIRRRRQHIRNLFGTAAVLAGIWKGLPIAYDAIAPMWESELETLMRRAGNKLGEVLPNFEGMEFEYSFSEERLDDVARARLRASLEEIVKLVDTLPAAAFNHGIVKIEVDSGFDDPDFYSAEGGYRVAISAGTTPARWKDILTNGVGGVPMAMDQYQWAVHYKAQLEAYFPDTGLSVEVPSFGEEKSHAVRAYHRLLKFLKAHEGKLVDLSEVNSITMGKDPGIEVSSYSSSKKLQLDPNGTDQEWERILVEDEEVPEVVRLKESNWDEYLENKLEEIEPASFYSVRESRDLATLTDEERAARQKFYTWMGQHLDQLKSLSFTSMEIKYDGKSEVSYRTMNVNVHDSPSEWADALGIQAEEE